MDMLGGLGIHKSYHSFDDAILFFLQHINHFSFFNYGSNGVIFKMSMDKSIESPFINPDLKNVHTLLIKCLRISRSPTYLKLKKKQIELNPVFDVDVKNEIMIQQKLFLCGIRKGFRVTPCVLGVIKPTVIRPFIKDDIFDQLYDDTKLRIICMESIPVDMDIDTENKLLMMYTMVRATQLLQCGVLHGDLFESNILLNNKEREILIIDFGYSELVRPVSDITLETTLRMIDMNLESFRERGIVGIKDISGLLMKCKKIIIQNPEKYKQVIEIMEDTKREFHPDYLAAIQKIYK